MLPILGLTAGGYFETPLSKTGYHTPGGTKLLERNAQTDFGLTAGAVVQISALSLQARYNHGLKNYINSDNLSVKKGSLDVLVGYHF